MAESLTIANGAIELLGGGNGVPCELPTCTGAVFTLDPGFDLGSPQPVTDETAQLVLDGEILIGTRNSNRIITLPVSVAAPDRDTLASALETLLQLIDVEDGWTLTWTRDGGLPLVFECTRYQPSKPTYDLIDAQQLSASITITTQAQPFGRSDQATQLTFASPLAGTSAPPPPIALDHFATVTGAQWAQSTTQFIVGPHSAKWDPSISPANNTTGSGLPAVYSASCGPADSTGLPAFSFWAGFGSNYWYLTNLGPVTFSVTLTDGSGRPLSFGTTQSCTTSQSAASPSWTYVSIAIPQGKAFDYTTVSAYSIRMTNSSSGFSGFGGGSGPGLMWVDAYLDDVALTAASAGTASTTRGAVYSLFGGGTSHAALSLQFSQAVPTTPFSTLVVHRPGPDASPSLTPFVSVGNGSDVPNGSTHYTFSSLISGVNAMPGGTYSVLAVASSFASTGTSHTVTATFFQYEYTSGPSVSTPVPRTFTPSTDAPNGMINLGTVTLPIRDIAPDNTAALFDVTMLSSNTSDRFLDIILIDVTGQTCWISTANSYTLYYLDEPITSRDQGRVLGTTTDRSRAVSVLGDSLVSGGPPAIDPGQNTLLCYAKEGAPSLVAYYFERYYLDRTG